MFEPAIEDLEVALVQKALYERYGYDFRHYAPASFKRRLQAFVRKSSLEQISSLIPRLLYDVEFFSELVFSISVTVTEMFRDPNVYRYLREEIVPMLKTYPSLKVWHAGCATGEEVYSLAILFAEEGLTKRTQVYATDINNHAIDIAKSGIYPIAQIKEYTSNYQKAGGKTSLADYYHADSESIIMRKDLRENILFSNHNLVSDASFGAMNLIFCRNVMIYFDDTLQNRVLNLFADSLLPNGFLCLGSKESLRNCSVREKFHALSEELRCYQYQAADYESESR